MRPSGWLPAVVGARDDVLRQTPADRVRYVTMGGAVVTTAVVAAVSAAFALHMAVRASWEAAAVGGLAWGVLILNLDRMLVVGMTRRNAWWQNLLAAVPRVALALLLGAIISTPLVLQIFQPEIDAELKVLQNERKADFDRQLANDPRFSVIPDLERQLAGQEAVASGDGETAVIQNSAVKAAQQEVDRTRKVYEDAQANAQCEIQGTCGTNVPGVGEAARQRIAARDQALQDYHAAQDQLNAARDGALKAAATGAGAATTEAQRLRDELASRRADQAATQQAFDDQANDDGGLLARLEALFALGAGRPDLALAQKALFLLFLSIEVLPVLSKLLQLGAPPTLYDELIDRMERDARRETARRAARREAVDDDFAERQADLEHDQARRQFEAGLRANEMIVERQERIAEESIRSWAAEAAQRDRSGASRWARRRGDDPEPTLPLRP